MPEQLSYGINKKRHLIAPRFRERHARAYLFRSIAKTE